MPWIEQIPYEKATGLLKKEFGAAIKRAGRIWGIVGIIGEPEVFIDPPWGSRI